MDSKQAILPQFQCPKEIYWQLSVSYRQRSGKWSSFRRQLQILPNRPPIRWFRLRSKRHFHIRLIGYEYSIQPSHKQLDFTLWTNVRACLNSQSRGVIMPSMEVVEFFQDEVQFP